MNDDSLAVIANHTTDSVAAKPPEVSAVASSVKLVNYDTDNATGDSISHTKAKSLTVVAPTDTTATDTARLNSNLLINKFGFFSGSRWVNENAPVRFVGVGGDPVPYKLSNDVYVTATLLLSLFMAAFLVSRSMHALGLQIKNFFYNRDRNETLSLKSEGEIKDQVFIVLLESFVLSLLFFSYAEFQLNGNFTIVSPYLLLFANLGVFVGYFVVKYAVLWLFNWTFFDEESRNLWLTSYNLVVFAKAVTLIPLVLITLYLDLSHEVCIYATIIILGIYEIMVLYKTKQIFFSAYYGLLPAILYFCTLELLPLLAVWEVLVKMNQFLLI